MKRFAILSLLATGVLGAQAQTASFTDNARVRSVEPQYENINVPRNECRSEWINQDRRNSYNNYNSGPDQERQYGGAIVGGLAGGVLGHQVGGGAGKDAATALGVVLGAIAGDRLANQNVQNVRGQYDRGQYDRGQYEREQREVQRCHTVYDTQARVTGYRVTYEYQGQPYTTVMRNNPGRSLAVRVSVDPIER